MSTDTTGEVFSLLSKAHPGVCYIGWEPSADTRMTFLRCACPDEDNFRYAFVRRMPDPAVVVQRARDALVEHDSPSPG